MSDGSWNRVPIEPQSVNAPLSASAIFLVVSIGESAEALATARSVIADMGALVRAVGFRDLNAHLSCNVGIGREAWDRFGQSSRPAQLHVFPRIIGAEREDGSRHIAVSTPGDLLFHIRSERSDLCFELERLLLEAFGAAVTVVDEVSGFRYFDSRDLLGFVDGTENPTGDSMWMLVTDRRRGSRVRRGEVTSWCRNTFMTWAPGTGSRDGRTQERIIGPPSPTTSNSRDTESGPTSHKTLTTNHRRQRGRARHPA